MKSTTKRKTKHMTLGEFSLKTEEDQWQACYEELIKYRDLNNDGCKDRSISMENYYFKQGQFYAFEAASKIVEKYGRLK